MERNCCFALKMTTIFEDFFKNGAFGAEMPSQDMDKPGVLNAK